MGPTTKNNRQKGIKPEYKDTMDFAVEIYGISWQPRHSAVSSNGTNESAT